MFETIALGLAQLSDPIVWIALVAGSILGIVLGAIPGIGPGVGIALLLPVTFAMEPLPGITLLMGLYAAGWYGGAIPAITINTPVTTKRLRRPNVSASAPEGTSNNTMAAAQAAFSSANCWRVRPKSKKRIVKTG